jgi:hypothetical protein
MRRRRDDFGQAQLRWQRRDIFGERRRRRWPWKTLLAVGALGALAYAFGDPSRLAQLKALWTETVASPTAPPVAPDVAKPTGAADSDRLSLPLPAQPPGAR